VFSKLDAKSGYPQIQVATDDQPKAAFWFKGQLFMYTKMHFGTKNSPAAYHRRMDEAIRKAGISQHSMAYIDDILIHSKDWASQEAKIQAIRNLPVPQNLPDLKRTLGLLSYYRANGQNCSTISHPLRELTAKDADYNWNPAVQGAAYQMLKDNMGVPGRGLEPAGHGSSTSTAGRRWTGVHRGIQQIAQQGRDAGSSLGSEGAGLLPKGSQVHAGNRPQPTNIPHVQQ
jgi:hypothetical protein